jgi:hypothetical protein
MRRFIRTRLPARRDNEDLSRLLSEYGERVKSRGRRQSQIARDAWLDDSYISRLLSGERSRPSRDALILLGGWGLGLAVEEVDELLLAAEYRPLVLPATLR